MSKNSQNKKPSKAKSLEAEHARKINRHEDFIKYQMIDFVKNKSKHSKDDIEQMVQYMGFHTKETEYEPLDKEAKKVIRLDASGFIRVPKENYLTKEFKYALKTPLRKKTKAGDYNLNKIPCWKYMKLFKSFSDFDVLIKKALVKRKVDPKVLSKMTFEDVSYLFKDYAPKRKKGDRNNSTFKVFEGAKYKFGKHVARKYQQDYRKILTSLCKGKGEVKKYMDLALEKGTLHPQLEIHHNDMVVNANCLDQISKINSFENFIAVRSDIHKFLHSAYYSHNKFNSDKETITYGYSENDIIIAGRSEGRRVTRKADQPTRVIHLSNSNQMKKMQESKRMAR